MQLLRKSGKARKKWHKKALFVNLNKTRIIFASTARPKAKPLPSRILKKEPSSVIKEFLEQEQYGLPGFFGCPCIRTSEISYGTKEGGGVTLFSFPKARWL